MEEENNNNFEVISSKTSNANFKQNKQKSSINQAKRKTLASVQQVSQRKEKESCDITSHYHYTLTKRKS